jgi:hypothetical protein
MNNEKSCFIPHESKAYRSYLNGCFVILKLFNVIFVYFLVFCNLYFVNMEAKKDKEKKRKEKKKI